MLNNSNFAIIIPARYESSRLPGKVLADIHGFPMIYWTYHRACLANIGNVLIAADNELVYKALEKYKIPFIETSSNCKNGTERIAEVSQQLKGIDFFMNVQGDEPLLNPQIMRDVFADGLTPNCFKTAVSQIEDATNSSEVKVAISQENRIRFASRSPIPYFRDHVQPYFKIHGVYTYCRNTLNTFLAHLPGPLEMAESVEQLRCIEHDIPLFAVKTSHTERSVDTVDDLLFVKQKAISHFREWIGN